MMMAATLASGGQRPTVPPDAGAIARGGLRSLLRRERLPFSPPDTVFVQEHALLDARRIAAYGRACGFSDSQDVPVTFPHMLGFPLHMAAMLDPAFPYPLVGLVHLANTIRQRGRLRAGEALRISVRFGDALRHDKGQAFTLLTTAERDGEAVWESSSTYLRLGIPAPAGPPVPPPPDGPQPLSVSGRWRLRPDTGRRYAAVSGDRNPIHTSRLGARLLGFRRPIAHGMWMLARSAATLLPAAPLASAELEVAFRAPAFLPGTVLLLSTPRQGGSLFELRNGKAEQLHLRGTLRAEAA